MNPVLLLFYLFIYLIFAVVVCVQCSCSSFGIVLIFSGRCEYANVPIELLSRKYDSLLNVVRCTEAELFVVFIFLFCKSIHRHTEACTVYHCVQLLNAYSSSSSSFYFVFISKICHSLPMCTIQLP